jgi:L-rhamnose-H+ transport protein
MIPVFNTVFVLAVVGPRTLGAIYAAAEPAQMAAIIVPSIGWGFGGVGFGQSIKRLGVALGTSIVMGIIVVIGTALPAIMDARRLSPTQAAGAAGGVCLGVAGFVLGARAGMLRDAASDASKTSKTIQPVGGDPAAAAKGTAAATAAAAAIAVDAEMADPVDVPVAVVEPIDVSVTVSAETGEVYDFWGSMVWCLVGGVLSSMLQFAFVFGGGLVDVARAKGVPDVSATMPIWLLCFLFNGVGHCGYAARLLVVNGTWRRFREATRAETVHAAFMCALMALAMPFHIHTYGVGATLLGDTGAVFAWPVVMSATVFTAQAWSVVLGEFKGAPVEAMRANRWSLALLVSSVAVVAATGVA